MDRKKDPIEQMIEEDLLMEADSLDREIAEAKVEPMSAEVKERIKNKLHEQIAEYERERVYAQLSDEDRKALELGREMLKKESGASEEKVVYRKKRTKLYLTLAAVLILVLAMGVTSIGGAKRIVQMVKSVVGTREVVKINTDEDNYIVTSDNEEEAYQELRDVFGVDVVKLVQWPGSTKFVSSEIDKELQTALLKYEYEGESVHYYISALYTDSSWGIDVEDEMTDSFYCEHENGRILVREYEIYDIKTKRYSAQYEHNGLEYFLIGTMEKTDFEKIVKNLIFF